MAGNCQAEWKGVLLTRIMPQPDPGGSWLIVSATGYARRFPQGMRLLLATHVDGAELGAGNGFPIRLVAPERLGFEWVKWVVEVPTDPLPPWWQSPFPLQ